MAASLKLPEAWFMYQQPATTILGQGHTNSPNSYQYAVFVKGYGAVLWKISRKFGAETREFLQKTRWKGYHAHENTLWITATAIWWLNQPIWKIRVYLPRLGWTHKNIWVENHLDSDISWQKTLRKWSFWGSHVVCLYFLLPSSPCV